MMRRGRIGVPAARRGRGRGRGGRAGGVLRAPAAAAAAAAAERDEDGMLMLIDGAAQKEQPPKWVVNWEEYRPKDGGRVHDIVVGGRGVMVPNNARGLSFTLDDMKRFQRFLCLGVEGGSFYVGEKELGLQNMQAMLRLLGSGRGLEVVAKIAEFSVEGRTAKQQPLMLALAVCARLGDEPVRKAAYETLTKVCRIPTQLFMLIKFMRLMGEGAGWGRLQRRAIQEWYNAKEPLELARAVTKYANREGWTHTDVLRLAHAKPSSDLHQAVFQYITKGWDVVKDRLLAADASPEALKLGEFLAAVQQVKAMNLASTRADAGADAGAGAAADYALPATRGSGGVYARVAAAAAGVAAAAGAGAGAVAMDMDANAALVAQATQLIKDHGLAREHLSTSLLNSVPVWEALLQHMPLGGLVRNLAKMTSLGLFRSDSGSCPNVRLVVKKLKDQSQLRKARMHPFNVLVALKTYQSGHGDKGSLTWVPNRAIVQALDDAFHLAFATVEPTGKRYVLALDVSGSMSCGGVIGNNCITPREASAAMAMVTLRVEKECHTVAFCDKLTTLPLRRDMSLDDITRRISNLPFGGTDCAQPMLWALEKGVKADVFVVYTDCETWAGVVSPVEALRRYRKATGIPAKLIVVGMTATEFTLADPDDAGMLDISGFDSAAPQVMADFSADRL